MFRKLFKNKKFDILISLYRWNGLRLIKNESVAQHSWLVTLFAKLICEGLGVESLLKLIILEDCLLHDGDEIWDHDVNYNVKYNVYNGKEIRVLLDSFKNFMFEKNEDLSFLQQKPKTQENIDMVFVKMIVKICDWMSCVYYIGKEVEMGNKFVEDRLVESIARMAEVCDKFMEYCVDKKLNYNMEIIQQIKLITL